MPRCRRRACWGGQAPGGTPWRCGKRPLRRWGQGGLRLHALRSRPPPRRRPRGRSGHRRPPGR
eukprot:1113307-Alexandrium_andersonii.AAC.1